MPPKKRKAAAPPASSPDAPSLLAVDQASLQKLSLPELKTIAKRANMEAAWSEISKQHRPDLIAALASSADEYRRFVATVEGERDRVLKKGAESLADDAHALMPRGRGLDADRQVALDALQSVLPRAMAAAVHIIPSGSGVHLGGGLLLTCAHCISHDDDDDDEDSNEAPQRVGRVKELVTARGLTFGARCVATDESSDVALLRILPSETLPASLGSLPLADALDKDAASRLPVLAVGNPYDWDLERPEGARPRKNGFTAFWVSGGRLEGVLDAATAKRKGLGAQKHGAWTYWGHSGCPLVSGKGEVVAMHNSWDATNKAQRHAVPLGAISAAVDAHRRAEGGGVARTVSEDHDSDDELPLAKRLAAAAPTPAALESTLRSLLQKRGREKSC